MITTKRTAKHSVYQGKSKEHSVQKPNFYWQINVLCVLACVYTIYFAQALLLPIFMSLILYFLLAPFVRICHRWYIPKLASATFIMASFLSIIGFGISSLVGPANEWLKRAPNDISLLEGKLTAIKQPFEQITTAAKKVEEVTAVGTGTDQSIEVTQYPGLGDMVFDVTSEAFMTIASTLVLLFFFLVYGEVFLRKLDQIFSQDRRGKFDGSIVRSIKAGISIYLLTYTTINICLGAIASFVFWILDMPNPVLWGALAGCLNYIPYIGPMVGVVIISMVSLLSFESNVQAMLPPTIYFIINAIEGQIITPILLGQRLSLNPLVVLLSIILWGWTWGAAGAILSAPLLAVFKIICENVPSLRNFRKLIEI
ncbi:AI-2E family transporter [Pseudobacteriovorax antillogorgiicola]|uniref:Predicted PurR-regulated permease PerM n=1 Tax=Pseudobacteriovorax antillogorgiicola TaxID=1513793 RepID=A0A1Y6CGZ1_9BACT|nr:AI-2E family transporter [Pseudobacteriovorax antillogorgiicola]TCS46973.1 putative PurR-regulated permease PerM [Pseudobacteriovorax antillogorgiicola]SMF64679.1 Predicted PurR-regulated permease PerM [Pseudobacteriovorax antillogorgiicola]